MNNTIITAIKNQEVLSLTYDGISREVEPHAYGFSNKGNELLRCYQISGGHHAERPHEWELLTVSKISALANTESFPIQDEPEGELSFQYKMSLEQMAC